MREKKGEEKNKVKLGPYTVGEGEEPVFIAGPCVIENEDTVMRTAEFLSTLRETYSARIIFKASYDKANRTSIKSFRGPGLEKGLRILNRVKEQFGFPLTTDVHCRHEVKYASEVVDVVQIPAFLSRQTDLLLEAGAHARAVNIKKGQFMSAQGAVKAAEKVISAGGKNVTITERGTTFGYSDLVVDFRNIPLISSAGFPVIMDITHSLQKPEAMGDSSGGDRSYAIYMARAGIAVGACGIFAEIHPDPPSALSDSQTVLPLSEFEKILHEVIKLHKSIYDE